MVTAALVFLSALGLILPHGDNGEAFRIWLTADTRFQNLLLALWAVIIAEGLIGLFLAADAWSARLKRLLLITLLPPLRMTTAVSTPNQWLWVPRHGWKHTGEATSERMEQRLTLPMLFLTLLVLPVLGVELAVGESLEHRPVLALAMHVATSFIWIGFTAEFIWMLSATPKKMAYCLKNWINLVIILPPLVAFLRVLTTFRFVRMLRAGKLLRAYRLRTLQARLWRLALLFNLFDRLQQRNPAKYCAGLEKKITDLEAEVALLKDKLGAYRERIKS